MQYSWLAIALLALVVILGVIVGIRQSVGTIQRQATMLSLAVLAIMGMISCVVAPLLGLDSLFPVFALLSFVLPLIAYAAVVSIAGKTASTTTAHDFYAGTMSPAHAKLARKKPLVISLKEEEDEVVSTPEDADFIAPISQEANKQESAHQSPTKFTHIPETIPTVDKEVLMAAFGDEQTDEAPVRQNVPTVSYPPPLGEVKAAREKTAVTSEMSTPVEAASPASTPTDAALISKAPALAALAAEPTFATCFLKATTLKEKGAYAVAARLFAKATVLSESGADGRRARFEEIICYVKAAQPDRARVLASEMREQATTMTKVERIKLDAIARML